MTLRAVRSFGKPVLWLLCLFLTITLTGCGSGEGAVSTTVTPLAAEDIAGPCTYDLTLEPFFTTQKGVLVLFERGDTDDLYHDSKLRDLAHTLGFAIVWAHQCPSAYSNDLQADASKGPGRMLFAAISALGDKTGHTELKTAGVILYGFSAAGTLTATMANDYPQRLLGTIQYAAGGEYYDLDSLAVTAGGAAIPTLILANAKDLASGTGHSFRYFKRGRALGAPWAYGVQNDTGHCCNISTRDLILPWIQAIASRRLPSVAGQQAPQPIMSAGTLSHFVCTPDGTQDSYGETDCAFTAESVGQGTLSKTGEQSGWLPDANSAAAWLTWVTSASTN